MRAAAIATAFREVRSHPWRSFLACQGVLWAVTMVVLPGSIVGGTKAASVERAEELGTSYIEITADPDAVDAEIPREGDLEQVRAQISGAVGAQVAAEVSLAPLRARAVRVPGRKEYGWLLGTDPALIRARRVTTLEGRFPAWGGSPPADGSLEVALESHLAKTLFPDRSAIGERVAFVPEGAATPSLRPWRAGDTVPVWNVVGVVSDATTSSVDIQGYQDGHMMTDSVRSLQASFGVALNRMPFLQSGLGVYVPLSAVPGDKTPVLFIHCPPLEVEVVGDRIEATYVALGRRPLMARNAIWNVLLKPELDGFMSIHDVVSGIYLVIGLLIMTNLLLLSGRQRRREIALRRAEGASRSDVFLQFMWEGGFLALLGVIGGVPAGLMLGYLRISLDPNVAFALTMPWGPFLEGMIWITIGTLLASTYPAWRATLYQPMTILRRDTMT